MKGTIARAERRLQASGAAAIALFRRAPNVGQQEAKIRHVT